MKVLKHKNLMGLIFTALLSLPLLGIGVRSGYVIANKNAYQSYYGETINEKTAINPTELDLNTLYYFDISNHDYSNINVSEFQLFYTPIEVINTNYPIDFMSSNKVVIKSGVSNDISRIQYSFYSNDTHIGTYYSNWDSVIILTMQYVTTNNQERLDYYLDHTTDIYYYEYNKYSYLDNVFEYSVSQFTSENNLGNVNLFSWFTNMFLSDNPHNNLYVGFANWYMNYAMLVACMHLLFLVLMWFINFARRLLERGMNYDF